MHLVIAELDFGMQGTLADLNPGNRFTVRRDVGALLIGLPESAAPMGLDDVRAVMRAIASSAIESDVGLVWRFSAVSMKCAAVGDILRRWDETGEPPLLSFIGFDLGPRRHTTRGMAAFTGYEIAAEFSGPSRARHAARNLARLARHALMFGGLSREASYEATDGAILHLGWPNVGSLPKVVTIFFQ